MAEIEVPPFFLCPITLEIMKDPVILSTGITYDRDSIEKWIFCKKNNTCPVTKQVLDQDLPELTPNVTLRRVMQSWCTLHAIERLPTPKAPIGRSQILKLLNDVVSESPQTQLKSLQTLKSISSENQTNKRSIETAGGVEFLASLIVKDTLEAQESKAAVDEALSILYNLQLSESSLKILNNGDFIESLTLVLQFGSYESRAYAIMLLKSIFELADPSLLINLKPEFFTEIARILKDKISQKASKATVEVLISSCLWGRNRVKAGEAGLVHILIDLLLDNPDKRASEMTLMVLDMLSQCAEGRAELLKHGAGLAVVSKKILRVSQVASERAVRILHSVCKFSATPAVLQEMLQIGVVGKLCLVLQVDCGLKMKERAREMLKLHARAWRNSSCLPKNLISSYPC